MILVCGEGLIDLFRSGHEAADFTARVGGSSLNVAMGTARLGARTAFLGGVSTDYFGEMLMAAIEREGIETGFVDRTARPSPLVLIAPDQAGHPTYTFYAHQTAEHGLTADHLPTGDLSHVEVIVLGSYSLAIEPTGSSLLAFAEQEGGRRTISLDANLRLAMVGAVADWRLRFERFAKCAAIIKLSDEDFVAGWGPDGDMDRCAERWLASGTALVVMTQGAAGATAWWPGGKIAVPAQRVAVIDTVGAGDSFHAGLLVRLAELGKLSRPELAALDAATVEEVITFAAAAAAVTCGRRGADLPVRAEMELSRVG